uniref:Transmembrane protein putative n=1 Tax=Albugo laibachii Nc14 TaxID=890382 RepID=F0WN61_9STRA|nr:transmembrane protein putative [Albugo laibachii Nc14]|eukprot:CCA22750.1 transmembrane protein putative [Albugo laibachii Nc14]
MRSPMKPLELNSSSQIISPMRQHATPHSPQCSASRDMETELEDTINLPDEKVWSLLDDAIYSDGEHKLYRHYVPNETLPRYYLRGNMPFPADTVFDTLFDTAYSELWKPMGIKVTKTLATIDSQPLDKILHVICELPWPFLPRDYVYQRHLRYYQRLDRNIYVMISRAISDGRAPESDGVNRVEIFYSRILVREAENGSCDIFMEYQDDTHFSIPGYITKIAISLILPVFLRELSTACEEFDDYESQLETQQKAKIPSVCLRKVVRNLQDQKSRDGEAKIETYGLNSTIADRDRLDRNLLSNAAMKSGRGLEVLPNSIKLGTAAEFTVVFYKEETGLQISVDSDTGNVIVNKYDRVSQGSTSMNTSKLREGSRLMTINGMRISGLPYNDVLVCLKNSHRPMKLRFQNVGLSETPLYKNARIIKHPKARLRCTVPSDSIFKFIASLRPFRTRNGKTGAILHESISLQTRSTMFRSSPKYITVASGFVLQKVDGCNVLSVSLTDIQILLVQDRDLPKRVTLYATDAVEEFEDLERASFLSSLSSSISQAMPRYSSSSSCSLLSRKSGDLEHEEPIQHSSDEDLDDQVKGESHLSDMECLLDYSGIVVSEDNVEWAWRHIQALRVEERLISVNMLLEKLEKYISQMDKRQASLHSCRSVQTEMEEDKIALTRIKKRNAVAQEALYEFNYEKEAEWQFAQSYLGVSTYWKPGDSGTIWLKMDGLIEGADVLNTLAVIREIDLYRLWAPFCTISEVLKEVGRVELLAYFSVSLPFLTRDAVLHAFGVNACYEHRCILLLGQSAPDDMIQVPKMKGWNVDRIDIRGFRAKIVPIEPSKAQACIVVNMDIKCAIPKSLLNFGIRKGAGLIHHLTSRQAMKIEKARRENTSDEHLERIQSDPSEVYSWLRPRMSQWFDYKQKNLLPVPLPLEFEYQKASQATSEQPSTTHTTESSDIDPCPNTMPVQAEVNQVTKSLTVSAPTRLRMSTFSSWSTWSALSFLYLLLSLDLNHPLWITCISKFTFTYSFAQVGFRIVPQRNSKRKTVPASVPPSSRDIRAKKVMFAIAYDLTSTYLARAWVHGHQAGWGWICSDFGHRRLENICFVTSCVAFIGAAFVVEIVYNSKKRESL